MSGRRFLDAAKLLHATRSVAKQHVALRSRQFDDFNKTSSLAKAVKGQTDRVTLTAQAAVAIAKKLNQQAPTYSYSESYPPPQSQGASRKDWVPTIEKSRAREGVRQDHHYEVSAENTTVDSPPTGDLSIRQEKAAQSPLPGGTVLPGIASYGGGPLEKRTSGGQEPSAAEARGAQRQFEGQIPSVTTTDSTSTPSSGLSAGHDQDVYYDRPTDKNVDYSSLPRAKIPKHTEERQEGESHLDQSGINADTFYSTVGKQAEAEKEMHQFAAEMAADANTKIPDEATREANPFQMRESRVPASRLGRLWEYSGLATSMAFGAVGESLRRVTSGGAGGSLMLSPANMKRLVAKLSRMRGAALKLGQMISFQDLKMLPAPIHEVLQRVQDSADYMPASQRDRVLTSNLGADWRSLFSTFDEIPIAAASIGQVHRATLASTGQQVAVKIQYPGVASSIDSDLNNLSILLTASRLLPSGLFLDRTIANARTELAWECDYIREAECAIRFKSLVASESDIFTVPAVIPEASGKEVMTAELMHGIAVTKIENLTQDERDWIGTHILRLCLREICEFRFMQTDPNWTNFLFNSSTKKLELLDFGASRDFPLKFIEPYVGILKASSINDRATIKNLSIELGYLTGSETPTMVKAHIDSVLTLAEPFKQDGPEIYDFRNQTITDRVRELIPVMVKERLAPPPEETYSLHRKLSGAFLLCARLGSKVKCRELLFNAMEKFEARNGNVV